MDRVGNYRVVTELARGGTGVVFEVEDPDGQRLALKLFLEPDPGPRFAQELEAAGRLRHPGIVRIHGSERDRLGRRFLVMELVQGETLGDRLRREGPLAPWQAVSLTRQLGEALSYAHSCGILHRDLKPENVLLASDGRALLSDFGVARIVDQSQHLTKTGEVVGTPGFMPPEQARGQKELLGVHSDVYGLGALLYAMLSARAPAAGRTALELLQAVLKQPPTPLRQIRPGVPPELEKVCMRCLAKAPKDRFQTVHEVLVELETVERPPLVLGWSRPAMLGLGCLAFAAALGATLGALVVWGTG